MDNDSFIIILEILEEIKIIVNKLRITPLLVTQEEIDALGYNLGVINDYSEQLKRRKL